MPKSCAARYPLHNYLRVRPHPQRTARSKNAGRNKGDAAGYRYYGKDLPPPAAASSIPAYGNMRSTPKSCHEFLRNRATGEAYGSIIASGDRARILHYVSNNQECKDGELILMDFGAAYGGYNADLTRTVPVNGKFTARQRDVYDACLHLHNYAKSILKPRYYYRKIS